VHTAGSVKGMAVVKGTSKELIAYLDQKCKAITEDPEFQKTMADIGQPVMYQGATEYKAWIKSVYEQYGQLIKTLGIKTE
jgi:tripartite-type tricarboxylate transporter receptor subunit TctC